MAYQRPEELIRAILDDMGEIKKEAITKTAHKARSDILKVFKTEGRSASVNWPDLSSKYLQSKINRGFSEKKLQRTTTLRQSISVLDRGDVAVVGTNVFYGLFHELGTDRLPKRPFVKPVFDALSDKIDGIVASIIKG